MFFVLSGFLITGILIRTRDSSHRVRSFYARRALRIFPIYYLTLIAVIAFVPLSFGERAMFFVYLQNWLVLWNPNVILHSAVGHFWSLAVEEQFYLFWPLIVWHIRPQWLRPLCFAGAGCALLLRIILVAKFGPHYWIQPLTPTRGEGLLLGAAMATFSNGVPLRLLKIFAAVGASILLAILLFDPAEYFNTDAGPFMYTVGISGLGLLFSALTASTQHIRGLTAPWLRSFGKYSYGIYIYHVPVYRLLAVKPLSTALWIAYAALLMAITYLLARFSFELFERRFLALKDRFPAN